MSGEADLLQFLEVAQPAADIEVGLLARLRRVRRHAVAQRVHEALIVKTHRDRLVGHLSRDSTAIEAREKPTAKEKTPPPPKRKRGRPKKGEQRPKVLKRLDRQATMTLPAMLDELPTACDVGMKEGQQGLQVHLGRLQAAHRRGRRPDSHQLPADVRLTAR